MGAIVASAVTAFLNWMASFVKKDADQASAKAWDQKTNHDIEQAQENAQTIGQAQDALSQAANRAGRNPD
jgi:hypothetical protein